MMRRTAGWGALAAAVYLGAALLSAAAGLRLLPIYDGLDEHPPYRWVRPPVGGLDAGAPAGARQVVPVGLHGSERTAVATADGQAVALLPAGALTASPGDDGVAVELRPLDPGGLGDPPPGMRFEGNAYRLTGRSGSAGRPAPLRLPAVVTLRYPAHADTLLWWRAGRWEPMPTGAVPPAQELYADVTTWGTVVAAAPDPGTGRRDPRPAIVVSVAALAVALVTRARRRRAASQASRVSSS